MRRIDGTNSGFTLVEALVALTILAVSVAAIYQSYSGGLVSSDRSADVAMATLEARSKMAEVGITIPLEIGTTRGKTKRGAKWTLRIDDDPVPMQAQSSSLGLKLYRITVSVESRTGRELEFSTFRVGRK